MYTGLYKTYKFFISISTNLIQAAIIHRISANLLTKTKEKIGVDRDAVCVGWGMGWVDGVSKKKKREKKTTTTKKKKNPENIS